MNTNNKENVQFVISHLEGCSGNFLGYLIADVGHRIENVFRVDSKLNDHVLSINGRGSTLNQEIENGLKSHTIVITHSYDLVQLRHTFPRAKLIQIYPYTHVGNVLYNICYKKLNVKLDNIIDNHFIDIVNWINIIYKENPEYQCTDYWDLTNKDKIQCLLGTQFTETQHQFFNQYWATQLPYELNIPSAPMKLVDLIKFWKIEHMWSHWLLAWVIFVYERINKLSECDRLWTINDADKLDSWHALEKIESQYRHN